MVPIMRRGHNSTLLQRDVGTVVRSYNETWTRWYVVTMRRELNCTLSEWDVCTMVGGHNETWAQWYIATMRRGTMVIGYSETWAHRLNLPLPPNVCLSSSFRSISLQSLFKCKTMNQILPVMTFALDWTLIIIIAIIIINAVSSFNYENSASISVRSLEWLISAISILSNRKISLYQR